MSCRRIHTPTASTPSSANSAAATDESTPPDMATSTREESGTDLLAPRAERQGPRGGARRGGGEGGAPAAGERGAVGTSAGWVEPVVQADPVEAAMPARSRLSTS